MMVIAPPQAIHMNRDPRCLRKAHDDMGYHLSAQVANPFSLKPKVYDCKRTVRKVDDGTREGFVKRREASAKTLVPDYGPQGVFEGCTEGDRAVLGCVMVVDWFSC
jgi:hypothetical protein